MTRKLLSAATLCCFMMSCAYGQIALGPHFNDKSTNGDLKPGLNEKEVRDILGKPDKAAARKTVRDVRTVWTYEQPYLRNPSGYFILGVLTIGIGFLIPAHDEYHHLVFSDGLLLGWDLPDPYAPDLIIEQRDR